MTGRDLINYIRDNNLYDATIDCIEDIFFEVPVKEFEHKSDPYEALEYRPFSDSIYHVFDRCAHSKMVTNDEARELRRKYELKEVLNEN